MDAVELFEFFFAQKYEDRSYNTVKHTTTSNANPSQVTHAASPNPTDRKSLSTWCTLGVSPSASNCPPLQEGSCKRSCTRTSQQTAPQTPSLLSISLQDNWLPSGAGFCQMLAEALASSGQRLPTGPGCTSSGYVRSLRCCASANVIPSLAAVPRRADPSRCKCRHEGGVNRLLDSSV